MKKLLQTVLLEMSANLRGTIANPKTIKYVAKEFITRKDGCKNIWGLKETQRKDMEALLLNLIAASMFVYEFIFSSERS